MYMGLKKVCYEFESDGRVGPEFFLVVPLHFLALKVRLVVLASAFVMVSTVWSVYCFLFFYSRCPPFPAICKMGAHAPVPYGVGATVHGEQLKVFFS